MDLEFIEYRKITPYGSSQKSPTLTLAIREAISRRKIFLELMEDMHHSSVSFSQFRLNSKDIHKLANHLRTMLEIDLKEQKTWLYHNGQKDTAHYNFINQWKDQISSKLGVLIFEIPRLPLSEMRAMCIYFDKHPIILLNSADSPNGRIFSLFHELTHLVLGESAICDVDKNNSKEWLCNSVAAQFLVPADDLLQNPIVLKNNSKEGSPVSNQMKHNGKLYSSLILSAYQNGTISNVEFSQYIGLQLKHANELSKRLSA